MIIILLGPAGSGKSTQAKLLARKLEIPAISMGQVLRDAKKARTVLGLEAAKFVEEGKLVPSRIMEALTRFRLEEKDCEKGFIIDGAPRRVEEAVMFDDYLSKKQKKIDKVMLLVIPDQEAVKRLLKRYKLPKDRGGGRLDDNISDIKVRLAEYHDNIEPVRTYYQEKDLLEIVDGRGTIEEIHKRICAIFQL
jgi:adenylate kinase